MTMRNKAKKILVVDNDESTINMYKMRLEHAGYMVKAATSGRQALGVMETFQPDLLTLDIRIPGMNGLETLNEIRKNYYALPIILCSAYGEYKLDFKSWAADAFIIKSSGTEELVKTVKRLLKEKG